MKNVKYLFCIVLCWGTLRGVMAQSNNDLPALERQICSIQDTLRALRQNYSSCADENWEAYEACADSLQKRFGAVLEQLCVADKGMKYEFGELKKTERQFTVATSADGTMRAFSRDTYWGGSAPLYASYIQWKDNGQSYFFDINEENDMGLCYDTIYSIQASDKRYYLLSGTSQIAAAYPLAVMKAVSFANGELKKETIFVSDNQQTDYLSISYRFTEDNIDTRLFIGNNDMFPRIVYIEAQGEILKPVVRKNEDGIESVGGEIEVYRLERKKGEIKFISNNKVGSTGGCCFSPNHHWKERE